MGSVRGWRPRATGLWVLYSVSNPGHIGPPDLHGFFKCVMDAFSAVNEFVRTVVRERKATRLQAWSNWFLEILPHPYKGLRLDFAPLVPYLVLKPADFPIGAGILVQHRCALSARMPFFRREGHPVVTPLPSPPSRPSWNLLGSHSSSCFLSFAHSHRRGT